MKTTIDINGKTYIRKAVHYGVYINIIDVIGEQVIATSPVNNKVSILTLDDPYLQLTEATPITFPVFCKEDEYTCFKLLSENAFIKITSIKRLPDYYYNIVLDNLEHSSDHYKKYLGGTYTDITPEQFYKVYYEATNALYYMAEGYEPTAADELGINQNIEEAAL